MPSVRVDGNDVLAVVDAARTARATRGRGRGADVARADHLPDGRAHQLRRPHALRARRRPRGVAGARPDRAVPRAVCASSATATTPRTSRSSTRSRRGSSASSTPPSSTRSTRTTRSTTSPRRTVPRSTRERARAARGVAGQIGLGDRRRRRPPTTTGTSRGEHDHARGHPRHAGSTRWRATSASSCSARTSAATVACSAPPTALLDQFGDSPRVRHADLGVGDHRRARRSLGGGARAGGRDPVRRLQPAGVPPDRRAARRACGTAAGAGSTARSPCAPPTAAACARPSTTPTRWRRRTRTRPG